MTVSLYTAIENQIKPAQFNIYTALPAKVINFNDHMDILVRPLSVNYQSIVLVNRTPFWFSNDSQTNCFGIGKSVRIQNVGGKQCQ